MILPASQLDLKWNQDALFLFRVKSGEIWRAAGASLILAHFKHFKLAAFCPSFNFQPATLM